MTEACCEAPAPRSVHTSTSGSVTDWIRRGHISFIARNPYLEDICCVGTTSRGAVEEAIQAARLPDNVLNLFRYIETERDRQLCVRRVS